MQSHTVTRAVDARPGCQGFMAGINRESKGYPLLCFGLRLFRFRHGFRFGFSLFVGLRFAFPSVFDVNVRRRHLIVHRDPRTFFQLTADLWYFCRDRFPTSLYPSQQ
jgi:hypothetical protein